MSALGKVTLLVISPFKDFFSFNKQKIDHQAESNSATSWTPNSAVLSPVSGSVCFEKSSMTFLPTGWFQSCLSKSADPTSEQHAPHMTPLPTPWEHNPVHPLGRLKPSQQN
jgi:hypothetical protein